MQQTLVLLKPDCVHRRLVGAITQRLEAKGLRLAALKLVRANRELAEKHSVFVPRPVALLELANVLRQSNPKEAANVYQQVKKEFPDTAISEQADRGLELLAPKS